MRATPKFLIAASLFAITAAASAAPAPDASVSNAVAIAAPAGLGTTLRGTATVNGTEIKLGDLFRGAGAQAEEVVAIAPPPGASIVFDADWLASIARRHGLDWTAPNSFTQIRVERAGTQIGADSIQAALTQKLADGRDDKRIRLDMTPRLFAPVGETAPAIAIDNLNFDQQTGRFTAEIHIAGDDADAQPVRISGRMDSIVQMPTLNHPMMPGEIIQKQDIGWTTARVDQLPAGDVTDPAALVGRSPRHPLHADQFLRPMDIEQPALVKRNELVLIVLEQPGMYLTAEGKATEDGGKGEVIRVTNLQSNRTIDTVVLGSGRVGIVMPGIQAMNDQSLSAPPAGMN